jgi:hypothetical protein
MLRRPDHGVELTPDHGDRSEAVDLAQRSFQELGGTHGDIDLRLVVHIQDNRDARGRHVISPWWDWARDVGRIPTCGPETYLALRPAGSDIVDQAALLPTKHGSHTM